MSLFACCCCAFVCPSAYLSPTALFGNWTCC